MMNWIARVSRTYRCWRMWERRATQAIVLNYPGHSRDFLEAKQFARLHRQRFYEALLGR